MKLVQVDPRKVVVPDVRVTAEWDADQYAMFQASLATMGQRSPIVCVREGASHVLVDGLHRLMEAIRVDTRRVEVGEIEGTMQDVLLQNLVLNNLRGKIKASQMVKVIEALTQEYQMDSEQISKQTGFSRDYIEQLQWIMTGHPALREALDEERIGVGIAYEMARSLPAEVQEQWVPLAIQFRWKIRDVKEQIADWREAQAQAAAVPGPAIVRGPLMAHCYYCRSELPPAQLSAPVTCPSCAGIIYDVLRREKLEVLQVQAGAGGPSEG